MPVAALLAAVSGLALGASLIVAIGGQNAFVLRQGLRGEHIAAIVAVCIASDIVLIMAGVAGAGGFLHAHPSAVEVVRVIGVAFLGGYGVLAARRAFRPAALREDGAGPASSRRAALLTAVALTWLNPHVYLDTVLLLGSVAATRTPYQWWFALGEATASVLWFSGLGGGARYLRPLFARPRAWQLLDGGIAVIMLLLAARIAAG